MHRDGLTSWKNAIYYEILCEHQPFRDAVQRLTESMQPFVTQANEQPQVPLSVRVLWSEPHIPDPTERHIYRNTRGLPDEGRRILESAAMEWKLPRRVGFVDLWQMLLYGRAGPPPVLLPSRQLTPFAGMGAIAGAMIWPAHAMPIRYTAGSLNRRHEIRRIAREAGQQVERSILEQARRIEEEGEALGWGPPLGKQRSEVEHRKAAMRLFRRVVLEQSWSEIYRAEYPESFTNRREISTGGLRQSVQALAAELEIDLLGGRADLD
jgi:hypothetical protein